MNMDLYYVEWLDSRGVGTSWRHLEDMESETCVLRSVGWLMKNTKDLIHIVPHFGDDPAQGCGDMVIPKRCVLKKIKINLPEIKND